MRSEQSKQQQRVWQRSYQEQWRTKHPGANAAGSRKWRVKNPQLAIIRAIRGRLKNTVGWCSITDEEVNLLWTGRCSVTGLTLIQSHPTSPLSPSLDRIDNNKGYVSGNCRFVCLAFNMLKGTGTDTLAFSIAESIVRSLQRKI